MSKGARNSATSKPELAQKHNKTPIQWPLVATLVLYLSMMLLYIIKQA
ncbi:hypothetical protein [Ferrimonas pelagia]|uniref:Uncharacterized protein n=1 Tax=Ferrimonas pelagia TaxID=1177826 RepID=A0ABP9FGM8_9GAMM